MPLQQSKCALGLCTFPLWRPLAQISAVVLVTTQFAGKPHMSGGQGGGQMNMHTALHLLAPDPNGVSILNRLPLAHHVFWIELMSYVV